MPSNTTQSDSKPNSKPSNISRADSDTVTSHISPLWIRLAYFLMGNLVLPLYFSKIQVSGQEHLPREGAVLLTPTHRSRWDALLVAYAAGRQVTGRDPHYMVTVDEMQGIQGWFIRRLGGFPINPRKADVAGLRHGIELLNQNQMLVIFPEGAISHGGDIQPIESGFAYIALKAEALQSDGGIQIIPMSIRYSPLVPRWRSQVEIHIGAPLSVGDYCQPDGKDKESQETMDDEAQCLSDEMQTQLQALHDVSNP